MNKLNVIAGLIFSGLLLAQGALAELQDKGAYVLDTSTGYKWIKPTETLGMTIKAGEAEMTPYGDFAGCRYPKEDEVRNLLNQTGLPEAGYCGGYCGLVDPAYAELLEDVIELFGDTRDIAFDAINHPTDVSPDGAGWTRAGYADYDAPLDQYFMLLSDNELVDRVTGLPLSDGSDQAFDSDYNANWDGNAATGLLMICDNWPTLPIAATKLDFEGGVIGTTAPFNHKGYTISGDASIIAPMSPPIPATRMDIVETRMIASAPCPECQDGREYMTSITISKADGGAFSLFDLWGQDPGGGFNPYGKCYSRSSDPADCNYRAVTTWGETLYREYIPQVYLEQYAVGTGPWLSLTEVTVQFNSDDGGTSSDPAPYTCDDPCQLGVDNIYVAGAVEIETDFDPWSPNDIINPTNNAVVTVQISTTDTFNSADVNPDSLYLGPGRAQLASPQAIIVQDLDGDGDTDHIFGFFTEDTGITCLGTHLIISGQTYAGVPFASRVDVNMSDDCFQEVEADVEPFLPNNYVYPDDDYIVQVKLPQLRIANGDAVDFDPERSARFARLGRNRAPSQFSLDVVDGSDIDVIFGFNMQDTGITCEDTEVEIIGEHVPNQYSDDDPFPSGATYWRATDSIVTQDCDTCHP
jgi:hypothetical protein